MREVHLRNVDLNLLHALYALLEERHVSHAAKRSFLSQPAMSRALDRLRETFGDPLLVRTGRVYERTPRGERMLRELESIMGRLDAMVNGEEFSPARSQERFRVAMTDHGATILLPTLLPRVRKAAPDAKLQVFAWRTQSYEDVAAGRLDIALSAEAVPPVLESELIFNLDFVCIVGSAQPIRARRFTLKQYLQLPHAVVETLDGRQTPVDRSLAQLGAKRRAALTLPFFLPAIFAIAKTDLVLTVPRKLAKITAPMVGLRMIEPPSEIKPFPYFMSWHPRLTNEAAHAWLREQVRVAARNLRSAQGSLSKKR
jgi:DNA-binding transcriptional LysR family regulator